MIAGACSAALSEVLGNRDSMVPAGIFPKLPRFPSIPAVFPLIEGFLMGFLRKAWEVSVQTLPGCIFMGAQNRAQKASCDQLWKCLHLWPGWSLSPSQDLHRPSASRIASAWSGLSTSAGTISEQYLVAKLAANQGHSLDLL